MNFISVLTSKAREDMHLRITLINGETIEGDVIDINNEGVLVINNNVLSGISFKMIGVWQLGLKNTNKPTDPLTPKVAPIYAEKEENDSCLSEGLHEDLHENLHESLPEDLPEDLLEDDVEVFLAGFSPRNAVLSDIEPNKHVPTPPDFLHKEEKDSDRNMWDSILSHYQNAEVNNNPENMEFLSEEMIFLGSKYPGSGVFYYNAACFKLKCCNYPDAGQLFERAFKLDKKSESLYNAAFAYLHEENKPKALVSLGIYFCIENPLSDIKMWYKFCDIVKETGDYYVFKNVLHEVSIKFCSPEEESADLLKLLLQSVVYVFKDVNILQEKLIPLLRLVKNNNWDPGCEQVKLYIDLFDELTDVPGLCKVNDSFDRMALFLNCEEGGCGSVFGPELNAGDGMGNGCANPENLEPPLEMYVSPAGLRVPGFMTPDNPEFAIKGSFEFANKGSPEGSNEEGTECPGKDEDGISLSEHYSTGLKCGHIYRTIPPGRYGFLRDGDGREYHFKYEDVLGNAGYIDSATEDNQFPVLFKSRASTLEDVATPNTAYIVFSPELLDNIISLARQFSREKDYPHAILELKTVLDYDPDNFEAGNLKERWEKLYEEKYMTNLDKNKINFEPKNEAEWRHKADLMLKLGMCEEALDAFNHARSGMSSSLYGQGIAYLKTGSYAESVECFKKVLVKNPLHYHASYARGLAYQRQGMYESALEDFNEVIRLRPDYQDAWKQKAFVLDQLEKFEESIGAYDMSLALVPTDWTALSRMSSVLTKQNRLSEAMECVEEALRHVPDNPDSLFAKGYIFQKEGKLDNALEWIEKSLEYNPGNVKALTKKAYILAKLGSHDAAVDAIEKAIHLNMNNPKTWYYRGVIFHYSGDYEKAVSSYLCSLELKPGVKRVISCKERAEKDLALSLKLVQEANEEKASPLNSSPELDEIVSQFNKIHSHSS
ncbi:hypothetical protein MSMTP_2794 [Methanosarcina sp. MTP4]|uniref:tetratricopeptide repeat protein n=1 Tax=Methanosarcina sp. MTP4 TaxID=1434100 RepID=UPI000615D7A2|nr:tetratricopeptide repeat protein [Methanosarcina sp. MTP4]AKB26263.1 hypothetical protein MSMTP_2794 [Methanosarcina sp. MTP4]